MTHKTYLVTGSMGFIGAWVLYHLVKRGEPVVSFDLTERRGRLNLLLSQDEQSAITFVTEDIRQAEAVRAVVEQHAISHIIHLAALQIPAARAYPVLGAQVNVVGMIAVLEAARQTGISHLSYASSIAVYGPPEQYPAGLLVQTAALDPHTLYGVYKQADEQAARVYWEEYGLGSVALRPYIVYGVGRDQGLTSEPTKAMLAAASGQPFHVSFGGVGQYQLGSDVALQLIAAADIQAEGAFVFNLGGNVMTMQQVIDAIHAAKPEALITYDDKQLPFPPGLDDGELRRHLPSVYETPLKEGVRQTIAHFEQCLADGRLTCVP